MASRREGLTDVYNRFHSPEEISPDIAALRESFRSLDAAVLAAYGWSDLNLDHGFNATKQGTRYTIGDLVRREILDRLLKLNHRYHANEQDSALAAAPASKRRQKPKVSGNQIALDM